MTPSLNMATLNVCCTDIAVDGKIQPLLPQCSVLTSALRLGSHTPFTRKFILRFNVPDRWSKHRILCIIHCVPCVQ